MVTRRTITTTEAGFGFGEGDGYGYGYGHGHGHGHGFGEGDGYGYGYGHGYGHGFGFGEGDGYGYGYGYGYGHGYGSGSSDGDGDGYGDGSELYYPPAHAFNAYHYIRRAADGFVLRDGRTIAEMEPVHEDTIDMCKQGLHASMSAKEAEKYAPADSVLTQVKVWGRVVFWRDKLVATDRQIVREITDER